MMPSRKSFTLTNEPDSCVDVCEGTIFTGTLSEQLSLWGGRYILDFSQLFQILIDELLAQCSRCFYGNAMKESVNSLRCAINR